MCREGEIREHAIAAQSHEIGSAAVHGAHAESARADLARCPCPRRAWREVHPATLYSVDGLSIGHGDVHVHM